MFWNIISLQTGGIMMSLYHCLIAVPSPRLQNWGGDYKRRRRLLIFEAYFFKFHQNFGPPRFQNRLVNIFWGAVREVGGWAPAATRFISYAPNCPFFLPRPLGLADSLGRELNSDTCPDGSFTLDGITTWYDICRRRVQHIQQVVCRTKPDLDELV